MDYISKSNLMKSKSSNSAVATKSRKTEKRTNKKSKSNAEFEPELLKPRGVFVERKQINIDSQSENLKTLKPIKAPPRPPPGRKRFLASVLTILSKTTTGTQFPSAEDEIEKRKKKKKDKETKVKTKKKVTMKKIESIEVENTKEVREKDSREKPIQLKKGKFRSKFLNSETRQMDSDQLVILQPRKDLIQTPSNYSEKSSKDGMTETLKWSESARSRNTANDNASMKSVKNVLENSIYNTIAEGLAKEVLEGKNDSKARKQEKQSTLVSDIPNNDDKKLYNFFVDLLETTFSVYNVRTQCNAAPRLPSDTSTKVIEIDESVAKKLNVTMESTLDTPTMYDDVTQKPSNNYFPKEEPLKWNDKKLLKYFESQPISSKWSKPELPKLPPKVSRVNKKKLKTESFIQPRNITVKLPETQSMTMAQRRSFYKKTKKKNLLNILKEQLKMEADSFEEPRNLYQALKVIARNKRKNQKAIHFREPVRRKTGQGFDDPECMFKRRRVLTNSTNSTRYSKKYYKPESEYFQTSTLAEKSSGSSVYSRKRPKSEYTTDYEADNESYHSLEVYGFDYESNPAKRQAQNVNKEIFYTQRSTPFDSDKDYGMDDIMLNFDKSVTNYV